MIAKLKLFCKSLAAIILVIGYPGIVFLMAVESSFIPFPSEFIIPPAAYEAAKGNMDIYLIVIAGTVGSLIGAYINYYIAVYAGRPFIIKYGKYFFITEAKLDKCESFFAKHGEITTFVGRLIPGIRQLISFPAGLARMGLVKFTFFTGLGAGIWVTVLAWIGWQVGIHDEKLDDVFKTYSKPITFGTLGILAIVIAVYIMLHRRKMAKAAASEVSDAEDVEG